MAVDVRPWLDAHYVSMRKFSIRLIGHQEADDLLHYACEAAMRKTLVDGEVLNERRWLNGVVYWTYRKLMQAKSAKRDVTSLFQDQSDVVPAVQDIIADINVVRKMAQDLPASIRDAFLMQTVWEMSISEISNALSLSRATTAKYIATARGSIGARLGFSILQQRDVPAGKDYEINEVEDALKSGMRQSEVSKRFGVDPGTTSKIAGRLGLRGAHGKTGNTKINEEIASAIYRRAIGGESPNAIAAEYKISRTTVVSIKNKKVWLKIHDGKND